MKQSPSLDELKSRLSAADTPSEYNLFFAALLREASSISPDHFFVVGGSAIEIYTVGKYTSGDIDIVVGETRAVERVLREWKFQNTGRIWASSELRLVVDLVKPPYTGSPERTTLVTTPVGPVRLAAIEDLLVKRLSSSKHWKQKGDLEHSKLLALQFAERIDWDYVDRFAKEHDVGEIAHELRVLFERKNERKRA